jgi:hypothetical protein
VTAYLLQQIQLLAHRDSHRLAPWSATGNRSAEPTFQFGYESCRPQRAPDDLIVLGAHRDWSWLPPEDRGIVPSVWARADCPILTAC